MLKKISIRTAKGESLVDVTSQIENVVTESGVTEGACLVFVPHTTAGLTINSGLDEKTLKDIVDELKRFVPSRVDFHHQYDTPADAAGHIKAVLVGNSLDLIITDGELLLGHSQSVLFCEFDGPRNRNFFVRILEQTK